MSESPPTVVKNFLLALNGPPSESDIKTLAKSEQEVQIWVNHLEMVTPNRKYDVVETLATWQAKRKQNCCCGVCG